MSDLAKRYGCDEKTVERNRKEHRLEPVKVGMAACDAIGRYGEPVGIVAQDVAGMQLVSILHNIDGKNVSVTLVHYADTPANRKLGRKIGVWSVDGYRTSTAVAPRRGR